MIVGHQHYCTKTALLHKSSLSRASPQAMPRLGFGETHPKLDLCNNTIQFALHTGMHAKTFLILWAKALI